MIRRGTAEIITDEDLRKKLALNRPLAIKAGFDPTAPDLHLGHTVLLRKLRQFQDLGHQVVFLIGDATALVGDPSGQSKLRKMMTQPEVERNAATYVEQVSKIVRTNDGRTFRRVHNGDWFTREKFGLKELLELASRHTVARLIDRDDFRRRMTSGQEVSVSELLYPLMQGYDSVMVKADVELGGTDQKFNLLVGRNLQRAYGQEPQVVITMPLLEGTDGVQKMSKSLGNHIGVTEPPGEQFGKLMSIPDTLIVKYFTLLTDKDPVSTPNPRDAKLELAETIVAMYHGADAGRKAREGFLKVFSKRQAPDQMTEVKVQSGPQGTVDVVALLIAEGLAKTNNEARRLIGQGGVKLNGTPVKHPAVPAAEAAGVLQVGSRHFRRLVPARSSN